MSVSAKIQRIIVRTVAVIAGTAVVLFAILVLVRMYANTTQAEAASIVYYPNFCLGGWKYPQHASGQPTITGPFDINNFTGQNSSYLESSVASQLFCGYFSVKNAKNPPTKAVITFNWALAFGQDSSASTTSTESDSYTNIDSKLSPISPDTGFIISPTSTNATTSGNPDVIPVSNIPPANVSTSATSSTTEIPLIPNQGSETPATNTSEQNSTPSNPESATQSAPEPTSTPTPVADPTSTPAPATVTTSAPDPTPTPTPTPATAPEPSPAPAPAPTPTTDAPQSFNFHQGIGDLFATLIAEQVHAAETTETVVETVVESPLSANTFRDFLEVSYSLDGIRWTAIGRVNKDNWKNFSVEIPVTSWDEVKRLQIMVSVLPTIDEKPDIYLDSMSMRAEYKQTVAELASQGLAAVTNAVDVLIGDGNGAVDAYDILPEEKQAPKPIEIFKKKLLFSADGKAIVIPRGVSDAEINENNEKKLKKNISANIVTTPSSDGSSFKISGNCTEKYFVVLTYKNQTDYQKKTSSFIANSAHECVGGVFSYDLAELSPDLRGGAQYLLIGEQSETGPWVPISDLYPIVIQSTTTVERIYQDQ